MDTTFIPTENVNRFNEICVELESAESQIGPSLAMVTGPAGRGKSLAAKHYATQGSAVYLPPMNKRSPLMLLREFTFELCKVKPGRIEYCLDLITEEMFRTRRLVIIDEADLLPASILEMLRNINERCGCPILLIGEQELKGKIAQRRRLSSRIRRTMEFGAVTQPDIAMFFKKCLRTAIEPDASTMIHRYCQGDWRPVLTVAVGIDRAMKASGLKNIPIDLVKELTNGKRG